MSNFKKLAMFGATALLLAACGNGDTDTDTDTGTDTDTDAGEEVVDTDDFSIAMITDTGGVDDRSFNQSAWEGMQAWVGEV